MSYCHADSANAAYLSGKTGLNLDVAYAWLWNECQSTNNPTNPLNIRYYGSSGQIGSLGGFGTYASPNAGLDAAASLINHSSYYAGIRSAIATKDSIKEARAIEDSPWAGGHYGGGGSKDGNIVRRLQGDSGHGDTGGQAPLPADAPLGAYNNAISFPTGHTLSQADVDKIMGVVEQKVNATGADPVTKALAIDAQRSIWNKQVGQVWNIGLLQKVAGLTGDASVSANAVGSAITDPITKVATAIGDVGTNLVRVFGFLIAVAIIIVGIWVYAKEQPAPVLEG